MNNKAPQGEESSVSKPSLVERIDATLSSIKRASFFGLDVEDAWAVTVLLHDCRATLDESGVLEPGTIVMYHSALLRGLEAAKGCIEIGFPEMAISNINGILDQIKPATATEEQTDD